MLRWLLPLILCPVLRADGLGDLRAALERLQGREAIQAQQEVQFWKDQGDGGTLVHTQGDGRARVEDGPGGLSVRFAPAFLTAATQEALERVKKPDTPSPRADAMDELGVRRLGEYLSYARLLLRDLEQCRLVKEEATTLEGRPVRLLRFQGDPSLPTAIKKMLNKLDAEVRVWITPEGLPLAQEVAYTYKGSKFFISFTGTRRERLEYRVLGQRLVVTSHDWKETYEGFGQKQDTHKRYRVLL